MYGVKTVKVRKTVIYKSSCQLMLQERKQKLLHQRMGNWIYQGHVRLPGNQDNIKGFVPRGPELKIRGITLINKMLW